MAVLTRLARLFRADLHAVLDRLEAPDILLQQAIREMEAHISSAQHQHRLRTQQHQQLQQRCAGLQRQLQQLDGELDLCFASANDNLVRVLLRKKLETEKALHLLGNRQAALTQQLQDTAAQLQQQQQQLQSLQQQAELFIHHRPESGDYVFNQSVFNQSAFNQSAFNQGAFNQDASRQDACSVTDADVELALLKEKSRRSHP